MEKLISQSEVNSALRNLLEALKDYNRALVTAKKSGDELVRELINHLEVEEMPEPDSDYHDQSGDRSDRS